MDDLTSPPDDHANDHQALNTAGKSLRDTTNAAIAAEPIAVIGIGCRFPGHSNTPEAFWELLQQGASAITEVPPERWDLSRHYDPNPEAPGKMVTKWAGLIDGVDRFDPAFFGISPREASNMDPQQRVFLEVAMEALANGGQPAARLAGSATGVFVGVSGSEYGAIEQGAEHLLNPYTATGKATSIIAGRLSYLLDLRGPSIAIDSACSASLVAVHLACQSLRTGECRMALTGGINLILSPQPAIVASKMGIMAPDGRPKTFDAQANGTVRGEGCGVLVLKRLSDALADQDSVIAVIRGTAVNQDGRSATLTAPNGAAQEAVVRLALAQAGVDPAAVGYIETHGSGTSVGDPIEVEALGNVIGKHRPSSPPCYLGTVKPNIGHLEAAAGIAGLIKAILALRYQSIPPNINFETLNPRIQLAQTAFVIPTTLQPWPSGPHTRYAGVSSFGWAGTNAHVIIEEAPILAPTALAAAKPPYLLPLSAHTPNALRELAQRYRTWLTRENVALESVVYSASMRRDHHRQRLAVIGSSTKDIIERIGAFTDGEHHPELIQGQPALDGIPQVVMVFPGQGSQWLGMARQLLQQAFVFQQQIEHIEAVFRKYVNWSLRDVLMTDDSAWIERIDYVQPVLCAIQIGLAALWRSWGIEPTAVIGHSMGEVAAAHVAGALSLDDAARIICERSRLMRQLSGTGAMAAVELSIEEAQAIVDSADGRVALAVSNSSRSSVLSGHPETLDVIVAQLEAQGVFCRSIRVDIASHSPQMDPILPELQMLLAPIQPRDGTILMFSTVERRFVAGSELDAGYWARNLRQPVYFSTAIGELATQGNTIFLEISPHPLLVSVIETELRETTMNGSALPSLRRNQDELASLKTTLGAFYVHGYPINWKRIYPEPQPWVNLPPYPWQRQRYWLEDTSSQPAARRNREPDDHPLLGRSLRSATQPPTTSWQQIVSDVWPFDLGAHRLHQQPHLPLSACVELARAAACADEWAEPFSVCDLYVTQPLSIDQDSTYGMQTVLKQISPQRAHWQLFSRATNAATAAWTSHAQAQIGPIQTAAVPAPAIEAILKHCTQVIDPQAWYDQAFHRGLSYGPAWQPITELHLGHSAAYARIRLNAQSTSEQPSSAALDLVEAALQTLQALTLQRDPTAAYVPAGAQQIDIFAPPPLTELWVYARLSDNANHLRGEATVYDSQGQAVVLLNGIVFEALPAAQNPLHSDSTDRWLHVVSWEHQPKHEFDVASALLADEEGSWLLLSDGSRTAQDLAIYLEHHGGTPIIVTQGADYKAVTPRQYRINPNDRSMFQRLLKEVFDAERGTCRGIIYFWGSDARHDGETNVAALQDSMAAPSGALLLLIQSLAHAGWRNLPRLWVITRSACAVEVQNELDIGQALLTGMLRGIAHEFPQLQPTLIDLGPASDCDEAADLFHDLLSGDSEDQIALRSNGRYVARLSRASASVIPALSWPTSSMRADTQPFGLLATTTGEIAVQALERQKLKLDEVEIQVLAWRWSAEEWGGLAAAVGQPAAARLLECAGIVSAVGSEVTDFAIGQEVVAWGYSATVSHAIAPQALVAPKPPRLSAAQAATLPIAGLSAYYALVYCARLQPGDRVLVHCAADPIGIASIQIARTLGAALTVSVETPEQQAVLDRLGLPDGRDQPADGFALIVDTSSGAYVQRRLELLRPHGALFVLEHPYQALVLHHSAHPRMKNSRLTRIDPYVLRDDIGYGGTIFRDAMALIASAGYGTSTLEPRTLSQLVGQPAIRLSSSSAVIAIDQGAHLPMLRMPRTVITPSTPGTYLLAGDFSAPKAALASWLFDQGIYDQAWFSPGAPTGAAITAATTLRNQGARIVCKQVVLSDTQALAEALATLAETQPPLRGVIYLPQLDEAESLLQLDPRRFSDKCATVILSAWNLHTLASSAPLEHFILYASTASILGAPQQAPQAAASAFLGSLAHYRRGRGLPGMAINWWGWEADGYAENSNGDTERRAHHGMRRIAAQEGVRVLEHLLRMQPIQATVLPFVLRQWLQYYPKLAASTLFKNLSTNDETAGSAPVAPSQFRTMLLAAPNDRHIPMLEEHLFKILRQILRLPSSTLDRLTPFGSVGLDSLMAMEFRNILEDSLSIDFPVTLIWNHRSIAGLAEYLSSQLVGSTPANSTAGLPPVADAPNELAALLSAINDLSLEEFQHMLDNDPLA